MRNRTQSGRVRRLGIGAAVLAALVLAAPALGAFELQQTLIAADGALDDDFGFAVAIDGDTAVVGADGDDGNKGAVYVFTRAGDVWSNTAKLTASDGAANDFLGSAVAIDGDTIVAGASGDNIGANVNQGSLYTFARTGAAARSETGKLTASDGAGEDRLGNSVAIDGDTIVTGARGDDIGANGEQGSAYTFARTGPATRNETGKLTASDGAANDAFGNSVAIDGDTIVAGAIFAKVGLNANQGAAYTFARAGAVARNETAKLTASDGVATDRLGTSVAIDGDTIVAGAIGSSGNKGAVYTFARAGGSRTETGKLTASDGATDDSLGEKVGISGATIAASAPNDDAHRGSVYTFARSGAATRTEAGKLIATDGAVDDFLGRGLGIDGEQIIAGAPFHDVGSVEQGSATVFFTATPPPPPPDTTPPVLALSGKKTQRLDGAVEVEALCDEACGVAATGRLLTSAPASGSGKAEAKVVRHRFKLKPATLQLTAGQKGRLHMRLSRRARGAAIDALASGGRVSAAITVTATDAAGNAINGKRRVKLTLAHRR